MFLKNIKCGKSGGVDGISAEHFVFADSRIQVILLLLFSTFITHGYLPSMFMKTAIVPIIKNTTGDTSDKDNYRPIAFVSAASKIFELCLSEILEDYLFTHDQQFEFENKHSTDFCIFTVKSVYKYYTQHSPVYMCFLDASKAFDKINHFKLFRKLLDRKGPIVIVRILLFCYSKQTFCVTWGTCSMSVNFCISNGVRQGVILFQGYSLFMLTIFQIN